ncbi:unnamed protein product [Urochloa decumbens]|uniref:Uncharacterized protein n=1 Tax=Urochloa decumbens TaxID=240449 RepID=A0ABC8WIR6_9POAL
MAAPAPAATHPPLPTANLASATTSPADERAPTTSAPAAHAEQGTSSPRSQVRSTPSTPLSSAAVPFYPGELSMGRPKEARWLDGSDDEQEKVDYDFTPSPSHSPRPSYRDALCGNHAGAPPASHATAGQEDTGKEAATAAAPDAAAGPSTPPASEVPSRTPSPPPVTISGGDQRVATSTVPAALPGAPSEPECCFVDRSPAMAAEEARLRLAIIATVGNASTEFSAADAKLAILTATAIRAEDITVKPFHPDHFLIECATQGARDRVLASSPTPLASTCLSLRPWTRLAYGEAETLLSKVTIEIDGIPAHAWDRDTASKLLAPNCWIESLDEATGRKTDLSTFKVSAWTRDPKAIPMSKKLLIAEPETPITYSIPEMQVIFGNVRPYLRQKGVLVYPVSFHLRSVADFRPRSPSTSGPSLPSDNGDSGPDGNPDRSYGFRQGSAGPRLSAFPRRDGRGGRGRGGGTGGWGSTAAGGGAAGGKRTTDGPTFQEHVAQITTAATVPPAAQATIPPEASSNEQNPTEATDAVSLHPVREVQWPVPDGVGVETNHKASLPTPVRLQADPAVLCFSTKGEETHSWCHSEQDPMLLEASSRGDLAQPHASVNFPCLGQGHGEEDTTDDGASEADDGGRHGDLLTATPELLPTAGLDAAGPQDMSGVLQSEDGPSPDGPPSMAQAASQETTLREPEEDDPPTTPFANPVPIAVTTESSQLRDFVNSVQVRVATPLLPKPPAPACATARLEQPATELPKRSRRQAALPLANVAPAKRAEIVLMKRLGIASDAAPVTAPSKQALKEYFGNEQPPGSRRTAMKVLFPSLGKASPAMGLTAA